METLRQPRNRSCTVRGHFAPPKFPQASRRQQSNKALSSSLEFPVTFKDPPRLTTIAVIQILAARPSAVNKYNTGVHQIYGALCMIESPVSLPQLLKAKGRSMRRRN